MAVPLPRRSARTRRSRSSVEWTAKVPRPFARTGYVDNYYFIAQWFPKLGVLEDAGWNTHQFHSATEFYADYGVYDVRMTVPRGLRRRRLRAARRSGPTTPTARRRTAIAARTSTTSRGRPARDFLDVAADVRASDAAAGPRCGCCCSRSTRGQDDRVTSTPRRGAQVLRRMVRAVSVRPHHDRRSGLSRAAAAAWSIRRSSPAGTRGSRRRRVTVPESVTIHEAGHQWWYGMVGSNEFEHAWMDEGLNTFSDGAGRSRQAFDRTTSALRFFGGFVPWVFHDIRWSRDRPQPADRLPRQRGSRHASRRRPFATGRQRRRSSPTTRPRCGCTRSSAISAGRCCSGSCPRTSSAGSSGIRGRRISSRW